MELLNLRTADLNITNDLIRIDGKGNKERYVPIGKTLRRIFIQYQKMRIEYLTDESCHWLFPNRAKRKMTNSGINILFQKLKKELKLTGSPWLDPLNSTLISNVYYQAGMPLVSYVFLIRSL